MSRATVVLAAVLGLGVWLGLQSWSASLMAKGDAQGAKRVQALWDSAESQRKADEAVAAMQAAQKWADDQAKARAEEQARQQAAERIAREQAQREQSLQVALAAAHARHRSLLSTIAQLNTAAAAASAELPEPGAPARCTTELDAATTARNALGACSGRYTAVAAVADDLATQVTGLQHYVQQVLAQGVNQGAEVRDGD